MEDVINAVGAGSGYALLALASIVFWRLFRYVEKDRDYWRQAYLDMVPLAKAGSQVAEKLSEVPAPVEDERKHRIQEALDILLRRLDGVDE